MSAESYKLKIFTPAGLACEDEASEVTLPAIDGEIGVLPQHIGYTGLLGTGLLSYNSLNESQAVRLVISGGFCNFNDDTLTILADSIDMIDTVDREAYAKDRQKFSETLSGGDASSAEWNFAKEQLARIEAIDAMISH